MSGVRPLFTTSCRIALKGGDLVKALTIDFEEVMISVDLEKKIREVFVTGNNCSC